MDFDHFKSVNDSWGHDVGDELLREIANRLQQELKEIEATVGRRIESTGSRLGRNEFVLRDADSAMYEAKRAGRGRHEFLDNEMHLPIRRRLQIKNQ